MSSDYSRHFGEGADVSMLRQKGIEWELQDKDAFDDKSAALCAVHATCKACTELTGRFEILQAIYLCLGLGRAAGEDDVGILLANELLIHSEGCSQPGEGEVVVAASHDV